MLLWLGMYWWLCDDVGHFRQVMRKLKSINSIRAKRKRYRNKKKDLQSLCKRWSERRVEYEAGITKDRISAEVKLLQST